MNLRYKSAATTGISNADPMTATNSPGRWLFLARATWVVITVLILVLNIVAIPYYGSVLKTACAAPVNCFSDQLTVSDMQGLHTPGVSLGVYVAIQVVQNSLFALVWVVPGAIIFWRRSDEPMALFCAFMLVLFAGASTMLDEGLVFFGPLLTAMVVQVYRYRRVSTRSQRQQTKWVVFGFALFIVSFLISISAAHFLIPTGHHSSVVVTLVGSVFLNVISLLIPCSIAIAFKPSLTVVSIAASMMRRRSWRRSAQHNAVRWT